jgi:hypothetical protein
MTIAHHAYRMLAHPPFFIYLCYVIQHTRPRLLAVALALVLAWSTTAAQELRCDVTVNTEALPSAVRDLLRDFESDVERYLNGTRYTDEEMLGDRITCTFDIFFRTSPSENRYTAQVFIGSQRTVYANNEPTQRTTPVLRIMDEKWEFIYAPGQRMRYDEFSADPLTDFLDFYAYLIIGMDLESYEPASGDPSFRKALNICNGASALSVGAGEYQFVAGAFSRFGMAEELTNARYAPIREAINVYHMEGLDELATKEFDALATIDRVRQVQNPTSVLVKQFFNAKNREIADAFQRYPDPSVYDRLGEYDPEHLTVYRERAPR